MIGHTNSQAEITTLHRIQILAITNIQNKYVKNNIHVDFRIQYPLFVYWFGCPSIAHEPLNQFASNIDLGNLVKPRKCCLPGSTILLYEKLPGKAEFPNQFVNIKQIIKYN